MNKNRSRFLIFCGIFIVILYSCKHKPQIKELKNKQTLNVPLLLSHAQKQLSLQAAEALKNKRIPRTLTKNGEIHWTNPKFDWTEGFFPGSLWYLYRYSDDKKWMELADSFQTHFETHKLNTTNHDLGFVFNCSYGNGYELTKKDKYKQVLITAANSLVSRFDEKTGCIKSWDTHLGWQAKRGWEYPVIIDNMMNLELLFKVSELTNDPKYKKIAIAHADTTLKNHFRSDYSSYHVIDYDPETGKVRKRQTAQGFSDESAWARGQAWGLYGYTVCFRYTKDKKYLNQANKIANFIIDNAKKTNSYIPYWDYNVNNIHAPKDVSAATITVSALIELDGYTNNSYKEFIDHFLIDLSSEKNLAKVGTNKNFLLKHSVGSIPHDNEIDVPLNYADYYYIEALWRYNQKYTKS